MEYLAIITDRSESLSRRLHACAELRKKIRRQWDPAEKDETIIEVFIPGYDSPSIDGFYLRQAEKDGIKDRILPAMIVVNASPHLQTEIGEAIAEIAKFDFPLRWNGLVPQLMDKLHQVIEYDINSVISILRTLYLVFQNFKNPHTLHLDDLKTSLEKEFVKKLLEAVCNVWFKIEYPYTHLLMIRGTIEAAVWGCRVFHELNFLITPSKFEEGFPEWADAFSSFLELTLRTDMGEYVDVIHDLGLITCDIICLICEREDRLFHTHGFLFIQIVYDILCMPPQAVDERFLITGCRFLKAATRGVHSQFFMSAAVLEIVRCKIVLPNLELTDKEEVLFLKSCSSFIDTDLDLSSRRRAVCELLLSISEVHNDSITQVLLRDVEACFLSYDEKPLANWKKKERVVYFLCSLRSLLTDPGTMDLTAFYAKHIVPELQDPKAFPLLIAAALRFLTTFRVLLPKDQVMKVLGDVVRLLTSEVETVRSFAAICIEKLFFVKADGEELRFKTEDVLPIRKELFNNLYIHEDNKYFDSCITSLHKWPRWPVFSYKSA